MADARVMYGKCIASPTLYPDKPEALRRFLN